MNEAQCKIQEHEHRLRDDPAYRAQMIDRHLAATTKHNNQQLLHLLVWDLLKAVGGVKSLAQKTGMPESGIYSTFSESSLEKLITLSQGMSLVEQRLGVVAGAALSSSCEVARAWAALGLRFVSVPLPETHTL